MKLYLLLILAYSLVVTASPLDITQSDMLEIRDLTPAEVQLISLYRRRRFGSGGSRGNGGVVDGMLNIIDSLKDMQGDDSKRREEFVKAVLGKYGKAHPGCNIVVVHTDVGYDKNFEGKEGKDWGKAHEEVPIKFGGRSKGYDIFWFKKGTFNRHGDGGWLNWGYSGNPKRDGGRLTYS